MAMMSMTRPRSMSTDGRRNISKVLRSKCRLTPMRSQRWVVSVLAVVCAVAALSAQQRDPKQYANTLDNPDRVAGLHVDQVVAALALKPGMKIADLGSGSGVFTIPFAKAVGPSGKVYAIDVDKGLLAIIGDKAKAANVTNIQTVV